MNRRTFMTGTLTLLAALGFPRLPGAAGNCFASDWAGRAFHAEAGREGPGGSLSVRPHCAVIGGGVAGLAAARVLCEEGWAVDLFERDEHPGGFCSTLAIDGFTFDLGPHVFSKVIRPLVPFKAHDLYPARFSEAFLSKGKLLNFPMDLLTQGYTFDLLTALAKNTMDPGRLANTDMEELAAASYGTGAG
jgi:hypothetical protein